MMARTKKLCKNCAFWKAPPSRASIQAKIGGYCDNWNKIGEHAIHEMDSLVYPYMEGAEIWTGPNFGCVHFLKIDTKQPD